MEWLLYAMVEGSLSIGAGFAVGDLCKLAQFFFFLFFFFFCL